MANAKKLPSGSWRVRAYVGKDKDGKKLYRSFTAPTKQQAELEAAKFIADNDRHVIEDVTLASAVERYLHANRNALSPSTIDGYTKDSKRFGSISHIKVTRFNSMIMQNFIASLIDAGLSPKTVRNTYGLLVTVLRFSGCEQVFRVNLPKIPKNKKYAPRDEDVATLYNAANIKLKRAIALAAFHSLRRSEISGLKYGDLTGNILYVHSNTVKNANGKGWVHKEVPKTEDSNREVYLSDTEVELLGTGHPDAYIVPLKPGSISKAFDKLKAKYGINMRFHDLRGYFASTGAHIGISDTYISRFGGWTEGSKVLKTHYQKPIQDIQEGYANKLNNYFKENVMKAQ